jgi:thiol:disulfide interchange protein DsbD
MCLSAPLFLATHAAADPKEAVHVDQAFALHALRGDDGSVRFEWRIESGYYLYRDRIELAADGGREIAFETPEGIAKDDPYFGRLEVYRDAASAEVEAQTAARLPAGTKLRLTYQGCQDGGICYAPETKSIDVSALERQPVAFGAPPPPGDRLRLRNGSSSEPPASISPSPARAWTLSGGAASKAPTVLSNLLPEAPSQQNDNASPSASSGIVADASAGSLLSGFLSEGGALFAIGTFFVLGLGLAFTPCVFPMYPILAGQLGRVGGGRSVMKGALHAVAYVLAMAAAFGLLGFGAAWSGRNLQMALQSPLATGFVSALFVLLAMSMFGAFSLRLPDRWVNAVDRVMSGAANGSVASSAGLGFLSALIVGPCVTAPLAGALLYIAQTGDVVLGAAALFALGLGQGVPLIVFGTIGGGVMPRAGAWMELTTRAFGFAFLAMAIWMVSRVVEPWITVALWGLFGLALALALGAVASRATGRAVLGHASRLASLVAVILGGTLLIGAIAGADDPFDPLQPLTSGRGSVAATGGGELAFASVTDPLQLADRIASQERPKLLYFTADWCVSCRVNERDVFSDANVRAGLENFDLIKVDVTDTTPESDSLMRQLSVVGPPTMLFIERNGVEAPGTRAVGELTAENFLSRLKAF